MNSREALEILNIAWSGRKDQKNYPNFDDINEALYNLEQDIDRLELMDAVNGYLHNKIDSLQSENYKLKKVIEILKNKTVVIFALKFSRDLDDYNRMTNFEKLTQEEYDLLKEYL